MARSGRTVRRARKASSGFPSLFFVVIVALCAVGCLQAVLLFPYVFGPSTTGEQPTAGDVNLPERTVRIFRSAGPPELILKRPLDLPEADVLRAAELDKYLFPGGERHMYLLLLTECGPEAIDLPATPPVLALEDGSRVEPVDLSAALEGARDRIPGYLDLQLRSLFPSSGVAHRIAPTWTAALFAYPESSGMRVASATVGERRLEPDEIVKDALDQTILRAAAEQEEGGR